MVTPDSAELLRMARQWEQGVLPFAGGLYDQPKILANAVSVIKDQERIIAAQRAKRRKQPPRELP